MPHMLKALVTISVWILFVAGSIILLATCVGFVLAVLNITNLPRELFYIMAMGLIMIMLSVIATWFRKKLE